MTAFPLVAATGFASGINAYLAVLVLGVAERWGGFTTLPHFFAETWVMVLAVIAYLAEFIIDKFPYVDSVWDAISTAIRPAIGATAGIAASGASPTWETVGLAVLGGGTALASHSVKAGSRLAINVSPEPFTNILASFGEDGLVLAIMIVAVAHPWIAFWVALGLLVAGAVVVVLLAAAVRRGWRKFRARRRSAPIIA